LYTVASYKDHVRARAAAQTGKLAVIPNYSNMFSQIPTHPSHHLEYRVAPLLDATLGENRYVSMETTPEVTGRFRYKYFRKPLIPYTDNPGGQLVFAPPPARRETAQELQQTAQPLTRSMGIQTMYRESEAQTDPFSPEYVLQANQKGLNVPEILSLTNLKYGAGLPAGVPEIEMIERARAKRAWEATLPNVIDEATFQRRLKMMEAMELHEWAQREMEIKRLQERRLQILANIIREKASATEKAAAERMERLWHKKLAERDALRAKMDQRRVKGLRKLANQRARVDGVVRHRDIISEYADATSSVYVPKARDGVPVHLQSVMDPVLQLRERGIAITQNQGSYAPSKSTGALTGTPSSYGSLERLETILPRDVISIDLSAPTLRAAHHTTPAERREMHMLEQLEKMDAQLQRLKQAQIAPPKPLKYLVPVPKPVPRVLTPVILTEEEVRWEDDTNERHQLAILLQRWARGRRIQDQMLAGKQKRHELINELRLALVISESVSAVQSRSQSRISTTTPSLPAIPGTTDSFAETEHWTEELHKLESMSHLFEDAVQAHYVGIQLDFINKQIKRLEEERRLAAQAKLALRTRQLREAQEAGKRQIELEKRNKENKILNSIMRTHQETIDSFLGSIVEESQEKAAEMLAQLKVKEDQMREKDLQEAKEYLSRPSTSKQRFTLPVSEEDQLMAQGPTAVVKSLINGFLFPEAERWRLRAHVEHVQQRFLVAAHAVMKDAVPEIEEQLGVRGKPLEIPAATMRRVNSDLERPATPPPPEKLQTDHLPWTKDMATETITQLGSMGLAEGAALANAGTMTMESGSTLPPLPPSAKPTTSAGSKSSKQGTPGRAGSTKPASPQRSGTPQRPQPRSSTPQKTTPGRATPGEVRNPPNAPPSAAKDRSRSNSAAQ
jgi:hypothetical protein